MGKMKTDGKRTAVITGAGSGIGKAAAMALARDGFELLLCGRRRSALEDSAREAAAYGASVYTAVCDVSLEADVTALVEEAARHWDHLDLLFNNAGSGKVLPLENSTLQYWNSTIGANLTGTFLCCREFLPLLKQATAPMIINNASVAARRGFAGFTVYSAAKGGVAAFSSALREELRPVGIRVSTLFVGATDSPFWEGQQGQWSRDRMMTCDDIGTVVAQIAAASPCVATEEIHLMPLAGAL